MINVKATSYRPAYYTHRRCKDSGLREKDQAHQLLHPLLTSIFRHTTGHMTQPPQCCLSNMECAQQAACSRPDDSNGTSFGIAVVGHAMTWPSCFHDPQTPTAHQGIIRSPAEMTSCVSDVATKEPEQTIQLVIRDDR